MILLLLSSVYNMCISIYKCYHVIIAGLFECQDPSIESRNLSKEEFEKQIKEANVSREVNTCQGKAMSQLTIY